MSLMDWRSSWEPKHLLALFFLQMNIGFSVEIKVVDLLIGFVFFKCCFNLIYNMGLKRAEDTA